MYNFTVKDEPFAVGFINADTDNLCKKIACGQLEMAKKTEFNVDARRGLAGAWYNGQCCNFGYGGGIGCNTWGLDDKAKKDPEHADEYMYIKEEMVKYSAYNRMMLYFTDHEKDLLNEVTAWGGTWLGHAVPNLVNVAKFGTDGLREKVKKYMAVNEGSKEFYEGLLICLDAIDVLGARFCEIAKAELEKAEDATAKHKIERLVKTFSHCPKEPAKDFCEACVIYVMLFTHDGIDSPGYFDQYMIDFWRATPYDEAREMLEDMWEFFHDTRTWNLCICGSDENWNDRSNELSLEILDVTAKYKYQTPNLTMRIHRNTPEKMLRAAAKAIATGCGMPTFYNDEAVCPALERLGIPPCDSHLYVMNGCNQIDIQGKSHMGLEDGEVNLGKCVELALNDGKCSITGKQLGAHTGDPKEFDTFEKFMHAVTMQIHFVTNCATNMANKGQRAASEIMASPLRSLTIEGCIEKGLDYKQSGPLYGHGQILAEGVADCIDSVAAVKKYVYEDKCFDIATLVDALHANFEGYDSVYETLKKSDLRFGNDIDYVDTIGAEIIDEWNRYLLKIPTFRGGFFGGGCSPFVRAANNGVHTGALPSGKKRGEKLYADSIGAEPGLDVNGPTALISSCLRFDHTLPTSGFILNIKFDKTLFNTEKGIEGFLSLLRAYRDGKGQQLSVTVVSKEELLDAKVNPDAHRDLIVRVGGYSDYFVNIGEDLQDNVIARTDYDI